MEGGGGWGLGMEGGGHTAKQTDRGLCVVVGVAGGGEQ